MPYVTQTSTTSDFIPKGAASLNIDYAGPPHDFHFLLLPKLTLLAFSSAVEPLRIANQVTRKELYRWYTVTAEGKPVRCSNGVRITPDSGYPKLTDKDTLLVCAGVEPNGTASDLDIAWIRRLRAFGTKLGGICTGAFALAEAGVLDDRPFTLHWENQPAFRESFPDLEPTGNLYELSEQLLTCGGGSASTDLMLEIIEAEHGRDLAMIVADMCIHQRSSNRKSPQRSPLSVAVGSRNQHLVNAIHLMNQSIEDPIAIEDICDQVDVSRRQLERLFGKYAGMSPSKFYAQIRLSRAHALLSGTDMSVTEVAIASGFSNNTHFAAQFKRAYGVSPKGFRKGWQSGQS